MLEIKTNWPAGHSKLKFLGHHKSIFGGVYLVKLKALGLRLKESRLLDKYFRENLPKFIE